MASIGSHRPRTVDWKRAAALLYGDWGTSKAYVIGLAFVAAAYSSFPIILAICALTAVVGYNYIVVCRHFPDGGGVYSAAREQSRLLASVGALLLAANFIVTAALSGWAAVSYFGVPPAFVPHATIALILLVGVLNLYGPRHSGSVSLWLAVPTVAVVLLIIGFAVPHLTFDQMEPLKMSFSDTWVAFVGVILALSGVEAVANITGVMKLDPGSTAEEPKVGKTAAKSIIPVAIEVVLGTAILGWAMLSMPKGEFLQELGHHEEDMLRFLGDHYATLALGTLAGDIFGVFVGIIVGLLLLSAVNTAILAIVGLQFMMAQDGEMPRALTSLNRYGVPRLPLLLAVVLPIVVVATTNNFKALAGLYAIGVVGAITVNLGSCTFNRNILMAWWERALMAVTAVVLLCVELTIAKTKPDALFFAVCVLGIGLAMRSYSHKVKGLKTVTVSREVADMVQPKMEEMLKPKLHEGARILVAALGLNPVMAYALDETQLRKGILYVLYVKKVAVIMPGGPGAKKKLRWEDDPRASAIMSVMLQQGKERGITVVPVYTESVDVADVILDFSATLGIDLLLVGASQRRALTSLLSGNVITRVAADLPEEIKLVIYS